jgi:hypothetical protein
MVDEKKRKGKNEKEGRKAGGKKEKGDVRRVKSRRRHALEFGNSA